MLTLIIPADWPQLRRDCPWLLHDATGQLLGRGCDEPAGWPVGDGEGPHPCRLLLTGHQVAVQPARLPAGAAGRRREVVGAAIEESLLAPTEQLAFAVGADQAGIVPVGVIARARLAALVGLLRELGWSPQAAWPLALTTDAAAAWLCGQELDVYGSAGSIALPVDGALVQWPLFADGNTLPCHVLDTDAERDQRLLALLGQHLRISAALPPLQAPPGPGFLDGELAPPRQPAAITRHFRPALRLALILGTTLVVLSAGQWLWQAWQIHALRQHIAEEFRSVLPATPLVDPARQLAQVVAGARRAAGQLADDDLLMLAATLGELPDDARLLELAYDHGQLRGSLALPDTARATLTAAAARRGQTLQINGSSERAEFTLIAGEAK